MKTLYGLFLLLFFALNPAGTAYTQLAGSWGETTPLPQKLSNNAVATLQLGDTTYLFSMMGIDTSKIFSGITRHAFRLNLVSGQWQALADIPGPQGRIAAAAVGFRGKIYLFGGYRVLATGGEITSERVDIYDPATGQWSAGQPIPTPVDDQVALVWRDSLIYLISGWSQSRNVKNVQVYNPTTDSWQQATPIIGAGVFGHAGAIVGDSIVYADGVKVSGLQFVMNPKSYLGVIDPTNPTSITWSQLPPHPGPAKYRMAAGAWGSRILFTGGTDNPYNFDGIGYNGVPSEPEATTFGFNTATGQWEIYPSQVVPSMDHRGWPRAGNRLYLAGGMLAGQQVTDRVAFFQIDSVVTGIREVPSRPARGFHLWPNFPNPFNPETTLHFTLHHRAAVNLAIYTPDGSLVRQLVNRTLGPGDYQVRWDGTDGNHKAVASGVYLYRLKVGWALAVGKMLLLR